MIPLEWHAVGDAAEIERLLRGVAQVGAHRGAGFGEVAEWLVEDGGEASERAARLRRPLPVGYARRLGLPGPVLPWGLVPPGRVDRVECVMPPPGEAGTGVAEATETAGAADA